MVWDVAVLACTEGGHPAAQLFGRPLCCTQFVCTELHTTQNHLYSTAFNVYILPTAQYFPLHCREQAERSGAAYRSAAKRYYLQV